MVNDFPGISREAVGNTCSYNYIIGVTLCDEKHRCQLTRATGSLSPSNISALIADIADLWPHWSMMILRTLGSTLGSLIVFPAPAIKHRGNSFVISSTRA